LLREDYEPKPVYTRLKDLIHRQWQTSLTAKTDEKGQVTFRGFYGTYDMPHTADGRQQSYQVARAKAGKVSGTSGAIAVLSAAARDSQTAW
jgi:hypothetical protein